MKTVYLDVRTKEEFEEGTVPGAINIDICDLTEEAVGALIPKDAPVVTFCASGGRSARAVALMQKFGYTNVVNGINKEKVLKDYIK
jgi:phage shock protein E